MRLAAGMALMVVGLVGWLYDAHLGRLRAWDRPAWTLRRTGRAVFSIARRSLVVSGWVVVLLASPWAAGIAAVGILGSWAWIRWIRSTGYTARRLREELDELRRREPGTDEREMLVRLVLARHPDWGPELAAQIVSDHSTPEDLGRILARMERGWSELERRSGG